MARGFLMGAVSGAVIGIGAGTLVSVLAPAPKLARVPVIEDTAPAEVAALPEAPAETGLVAPDAGGSDRATELTQSASLGEMPESDTLTGLDSAAVAPARAPVTGAADGGQTPSGLQVPPVVPDTAEIASVGEDPVLPNPQALAPMLPQAADQVSVDTTPAAPLAPSGDADAVEQSLEQAEITEDLAPGTEIEDTSETPDVVVAGETAQDETAQDGADQTGTGVTAEDTGAPQTASPGETQEDPSQTAEAAPEVEDPDTPQTDTAEASPKPTPAQLPEVIAAEPAPAQDETPIESVEAVQPDNSEATQIAQAPVATTITPPARPQIGTPAISLTERNQGVRVNRLGNQQTEQQPAEVQVTVITEEGASDPDDDLRPVARFGQPFSNPEDKPLMSIVLIDDGTGDIGADSGIASLSDFPYALSFAVDAGLPDAAERVAQYRSDGFDVLAMIDLPPGAQPTDAETTLGVLLPQMGEVVGVLEGPFGGLQGARDVADQVTAILSQTGHGLVTQDRGLNTMPKLARKEGVPADPIFRDFDSKDQTSQVIRRFLDQAAFKAGQEGAVIMLGRVRPETISALLLWGLQDRAGQVSLAPISATLLRDVE